MVKPLLKFKDIPKCLRIDVRIYANLSREDINHRLTLSRGFNGANYFSLASCENIRDYSQYIYAQIGKSKLFIHNELYNQFKFHFTSSQALTALNIVTYVFKDDVSSVVNLELKDTNS